MRQVSLVLLVVLLPAFASAQEPPAEPPGPLPRISEAEKRSLAAWQQLEGAWVPAELRRALEAGQRQGVTCWLEIEAEAEPELRIVESCGGETTIWDSYDFQSPNAGGEIQVRSGPVGAEDRQLVLRPGTPNEIELTRRTPGQPAELIRLYRLPLQLVGRLRSWSEADRLLVGDWRTEDGATFSFRADGTYSFEQENGIYRLMRRRSAGELWGVISLRPSGGAERLYFVGGGDDSLALAPVPPWEEAVAGAGGAPGPADGGASPGASEPAVSIRLTRMQPGPVAPPVVEAAPAPPPPPAPIEEPIEPKSRCGCGAAEGGTGLLALLILALRRK